MPSRSCLPRGEQVYQREPEHAAETGGAPYETDPGTGACKQPGKAEFGGTTFMFADGKALYTIETDGGLDRVSPTDGTWERVGKAGDRASFSGTLPLRS